MKLQMKLGLILLSLAMISVSPWIAIAAPANPLIRFCVINGGTFEVHPRGSDDMALCRWNDVVIDSQTILSNLEGVTTQAANVILDDVVASRCQDVHAGEWQVPSGPTLCIFSDDSKLSIEALKTGLSNLDRRHLKDILSAR